MVDLNHWALWVAGGVVWILFAFGYEALVGSRVKTVLALLVAVALFGRAFHEFTSLD